MPLAKILRLLALAGIGVFFVSTIAEGPRSSTEAKNRRRVRAVLYPYIPERIQLFYEIKKNFEAEHPDIELDIIDLTDDYYESASPKSLASTKADVYEIDSVFLQDFVAGKRIQELPTSLIPRHGEFLRSAELASQLNGRWYGLPHWVCGNFLFFSAKDAEIAEATSVSDLERAIGRSHKQGKGLFIDLMGKSTLGEFYLNAEFNRHGEWSAVQPHLELKSFDQEATNDLKQLLSLCDPGYCRNGSYHRTPGFYGRQFARRRARAVVGYSEILYYVLAETQQSCSETDDCLTAKDIDVVKLPSAAGYSRSASWVDMLTVAAECTGRCQADALTFINFVNSQAILLKALRGTRTLPPRYLLPARTSIYSDAELISEAPLYPKLQTIIETAATPTGSGLNEKLRIIGSELNSQLGIVKHTQGSVLKIVFALISAFLCFSVLGFAVMSSLKVPENIPAAQEREQRTKALELRLDQSGKLFDVAMILLGVVWGLVLAEKVLVDFSLWTDVVLFASCNTLLLLSLLFHLLYKRRVTTLLWDLAQQPDIFNEHVDYLFKTQWMFFFSSLVAGFLTVISIKLIGVA